MLVKTRPKEGPIKNSRASRSRAEFTLRLARQQLVPAFAKVGGRLAGFGIERVKIFASAEEDTFTGRIVTRPVNQSAKCGPAFRLEAPELCAVFRVDRNHGFAGRGGN